MAEIEQILLLPALAVARLGGSDNPLDSFTWIEDPSLHGAGQTVISPTVTLELQPDGSARPFIPAAIQFRDGSALRPVAPFLELWAKVSRKSDPQPLTLALLQENGATLDSVSYTVTAANGKAARRTGDMACAFRASAQVLGSDHARHPLLASSVGPNPLVSPERPIPLGTFQVIRPVPNRKSLDVDLSVLRVRYTPARGEVYGPPGVSTAEEPDTNVPRGRVHELVPPANRILNPDAAWTSYDSSDSKFNNPEPSDTYDGADDPSRNNQSFGVVDDTCDVLIEASLVLHGRTRLVARARVFCGPPDFAPDRRPFVSLADDLIDRDPPAKEPPEPLQDALDRLGDLFQRVWETASLANVNMTRQFMMTGQPRSDIPPLTTLPGTMTPADHGYFDQTQNLNAPSSKHLRIPYASVVQAVHQPLADVEDLALFLRGNGELVRKLIRPPYGAFSELAANPVQEATPDPAHRDPRILRDVLHDMRMPPYMRDSDATPLSLTRRQYEFLMDVLKRLESPGADDLAPVTAAAKKAGAAPRLFTRVRQHVQQVVDRRADSVSGAKPAQGSRKGKSAAAKPAKTGAKTGRKK
jgi:hypothetical protein